MSAPTPDANGGSAATALLERVAAGLQPFEREQRDWAIAEGAELSGWSMTEVQLIEGGDAALAERVLAFASLRNSQGASRRLASWPRVAVQSARPSVNTPVGCEAADPDHLRRVAASTASLSVTQREAAIVDAMVLSDGELTSAELLDYSDAELARRVLLIPDHNPTGSAPVVELIAA